MARPRTRMNIQNMTSNGLCVAVLCLASYLVVPLPFTPVVLSLHTVVVNLVGLILPPRQAVCAMAVYLLMGAVGLPVFAGGAAGPGKLFGPTGGFYFGFLLAVPVISLCRGEPGRFLRYFGVTALLGVPIQHVCAIVMMCLHNGFQPAAAFGAVSLPFLPGDIAKCALASALGVALNRALPAAGALGPPRKASRP